MDAQTKIVQMEERLLFVVWVREAVANWMSQGIRNLELLQLTLDSLL